MVVPSARWKSSSLVMELSKRFSQLPLKYIALARIAFVCADTASGGRTLAILPCVLFSAHLFIVSRASVDYTNGVLRSFCSISLENSRNSTAIRGFPQCI